MTSRHNDRVCGVCARPAIGFGYLPSGWGDRPVIWCCDDMDCIKIAKDTYGMKQTEFNRVDSMAAIDGGNLGGAYLDSIGKSDLATLTQSDWEEFCKRLIGGYRESLQNRLRDEAPF